MKQSELQTGKPWYLSIVKTSICRGIVFLPKYERSSGVIFKTWQPIKENKKATGGKKVTKNKSVYRILFIKRNKGTSTVTKQASQGHSERDEHPVVKD